MLDVVIVPSRPIEAGTDVPGGVHLRQGGSAATTARWLARLGIRTTFVCSVARDVVGRALVDALRADGVDVRALRPSGGRTGRIGVVVGRGGERSFVADRGAADALSPADLRARWFADAALLHLPAYSLLGQPLGEAGRAAIELARASGARVSLDLASIAPLLAGGRRGARALIAQAAPDLLFATAAEADALLGRYGVERLLDFAPAAIVKRGGQGATVVARDGDSVLRIEVATSRLAVHDSTGAGDAFDAGFLATWLRSGFVGRPTLSGLQRAVLAGHRTAARHLGSPPAELALG